MRVFFIYFNGFSFIGGIQTFNRVLLKAADELKSEKTFKFKALSLYDFKADEQYIRKSLFTGTIANKLKFFLLSIYEAFNFIIRLNWSTYFKAIHFNPTMPKVTVIVPNYNHEKYLEKRLRSILDQTFRDYEIIFLDDGYTDNSLSVYHFVIEDHPVKEILSVTKSVSTFIQWNKGVEESSGEYLWFAESDDWVDKDFLSKLVEFLAKYAELRIAFCQSFFVDREDNITGRNLSFKNDLDYKLWDNDFLMDGRVFCAKYELFKTLSIMYTRH